MHGMICPGSVYSFVTFRTLFWDDGECSKRRIETLVYAKNIMASLGNASIGINMISFIDLYLSLNNPFYPRKARNKYYVMIMIVY